LHHDAPGESHKRTWTDDHLEFINEIEDDPEYLYVYTDGSLREAEGKRSAGYGVVGYAIHGATGKHS
jgi:hypothetical protein